MTGPAILWLRRDLRMHDLPALRAAHDTGRPVLPCYLVDPRLSAATGAARRGWLRAAVQSCASGYGTFTIRVGDPAELLPALAREVGAHSVHVSRETTPFGRRRDNAVAAGLADLGVPFVTTGSPYAVGPGRVLNRAGAAYQVFTPFSRAWRDHGWPAPDAPPAGLRLVDAESMPWPDGPVPPTEPGPEWSPADGGEAAARSRWRDYLDRVGDYDDVRDRPDLDATSRLSAALKLGALHPRTLLADVARVYPTAPAGAHRFVTELAWREFAADVLWYRPDSTWVDLRPLPGRPVEEAWEPDRLRSWQDGRTGYPIVDAGMRQLRAQGWMHNRVRMITASFLVKDLHVPWQQGARHFLNELVDGDVASNSHGWQWVAGTGTDAAPYHRVFNPTTQAARFDPDGDYVRRWVPELRALPGSSVHQPWRVGGVDGYPDPIVDHARERARYLAARTGDRSPR